MALQDAISRWLTMGKEPTQAQPARLIAAGAPGRHNSGELSHIHAVIPEILRKGDF